METSYAKVAQPVCRSASEAGCAQCNAAYSCHDRRMGRAHLLWAPIALALLLVVGIFAQV